MNKDTLRLELGLTPEERTKANRELIEHLQRILNDNRNEVSKLQKKLACTYWVIVIMSIAMFILGIVLLTVPLIVAYQGNISELQSLITAGFGICDLVTLFLFQPIERIHELMSDMSQSVIIINDFQEQVALRLLETDVENRDTMGKAAEHIQKAAKDCIDLIEIYCEKDKKMSKRK